MAQPHVQGDDVNELFIESNAVLSPDRLYRYLLVRKWSSQPYLTYIMLNPSTADENVNDPTIERCIRRAIKLGYGGIEVVNLFAFRATDPKELRTIIDPIGDENDKYILDSARNAGIVVIAWGNHGSLRMRWRAVTRMLWVAGIPMYHLGMSKQNHPKHPLYVRYDVEPRRLDLVLEVVQERP